MTGGDVCCMLTTLLGITAGDNTLINIKQEKSLYALVSCTQILVIFIPQLYEKPQHVYSFQLISKIFHKYNVDVIVILGICQDYC